MSPELQDMIKTMAREILLKAKAPLLEAMEQSITDFLDDLTHLLGSTEIVEEPEDADAPMTQAQAQEYVTRVALSYTKGNRMRAADILGVNVKTLRGWIETYSITDKSLEREVSEPLLAWKTFERGCLERLMTYFHGNKTAAAQHYGVAQKTLYNLLIDHGFYSPHQGDLVEWPGRYNLRGRLHRGANVVRTQEGQELTRKEVEKALIASNGRRTVAAQALSVPVATLDQIMAHFGFGRIMEVRRKYGLTGKAPQKSERGEGSSSSATYRSPDSEQQDH